MLDSECDPEVSGCRRRDCGGRESENIFLPARLYGFMWPDHELLKNPIPNPGGVVYFRNVEQMEMGDGGKEQKKTCGEVFKGHSYLP